MLCDTTAEWSPVVCPPATAAMAFESVIVLSDDHPEHEAALNKNSPSRGQWCTAVCINQSVVCLNVWKSLMEALLHCSHRFCASLVPQGNVSRD